MLVSQKIINQVKELVGYLSSSKGELPYEDGKIEVSENGDFTIKSSSVEMVVMKWELKYLRATSTSAAKCVVIDLDIIIQSMGEEELFWEEGKESSLLFLEELEEVIHFLPYEKGRLVLEGGCIEASKTGEIDILYDGIKFSLKGNECGTNLSTGTQMCISRDLIGVIKALKSNEVSWEEIEVEKEPIVTGFQMPDCYPLSPPSAHK